MQGQKGSRRISAGIGWTVMVVLMLFGCFVSIFFGPGAIIGWLLFGFLGVVMSIKAWSAFTGTTHVGKVKPTADNSATSPIP